MENRKPFRELGYDGEAFTELGHDNEELVTTPLVDGEIGYDMDREGFAVDHQGRRVDPETGRPLTDKEIKEHRERNSSKKYAQRYEFEKTSFDLHTVQHGLGVAFDALNPLGREWNSDSARRAWEQAQNMVQYTVPGLPKFRAQEAADALEQMGQHWTFDPVKGLADVGVATVLKSMHPLDRAKNLVNRLRGK